jgi:hypothetical protein
LLAAKKTKAAVCDVDDRTRRFLFRSGETLPVERLYFAPRRLVDRRNAELVIDQRR